MRAVSIPERVRLFAESLGLRGTRLLVAVSGGSDSIALLHLMRELKESLGIAEIGVAHFNHGLRGEESDGDETFVAELAREGGFPYFVDRAHGKSMHDSGVENWARQKRYAFFDLVRAAHGYDSVATGHTADDQAETVLLRLIRGCAARGLQGIRSRRSDGVVRPLLTIRRKELIRWLKQAGMGFRVDSSNADLHIRRNWIRREILSFLDAHGKGGVQTLAEYALRKQRDADELDRAVNKWRDANVLVSKGHIHIRKEGLADPRLAAESIVRVLTQGGASPDRRKVETLVWGGSRTGSCLLLGNGWHAAKTRTGVEVDHERTEERAEPFDCELSVPGTTTCGTVAVLTAELCGPAELPASFPSDELTAYLDAEGIRSLRFRSIEKGDRFYPYGGGGERKVESFLKKQGFAQPLRRKMGLVSLENGTVVWIPGARVNERFQVGPNTKKIIKLSCEYNSKYNVF